jgi:flavin reductase (DIM6/NTAB) family NADH-FMN oxidoreductase RutF
MQQENPDPLWKPESPIQSPVSRMVSLDPIQIGTTPTYKLLIGGIVPRPIAFVSTLNLEGQGNLAPFSFFNGVSSNPPAIMIAITRKKNGEKKDTLRNIEATRQFVVNSVNEWIVEPMNQCSAEYPYGVDEMQKVGLTPLPSICVAPPRVKESAIQLECELYNTLEVGDGSQGSSTIVVGKILQIHIFEDAYKDGKILIDQLKPISRLGGAFYGRTTDIFSLRRP